MNQTTHNNIGNFIWGIANDFLRDAYACGIKVPEIADDKLLALDEKTAELEEMAEEAMEVAE